MGGRDLRCRAVGRDRKCEGRCRRTLRRFWEAGDSGPAQRKACRRAAGRHRLRRPRALRYGAGRRRPLERRAATTAVLARVAFNRANLPFVSSAVEKPERDTLWPFLDFARNERLRWPMAWDAAAWGGCTRESRVVVTIR
ncbi:hypothetical protein SPHINGO361_110245 [Sphingomonas sp. EC-HK361]|nr:hypothetical protein SPHINGO361_110245 [Sphingomonas sp. EC-HK361]